MERKAYVEEKMKKDICRGTGKEHQDGFRVEKAHVRDLAILAELAVQMWEGHTLQELEEDFAETMQKPDACFFLAWAGALPVGFAQCQLRHDYVEGTDSTPVGYLEGIFVRKDFRHSGCAKALLEACEKWAGEMGCREFASDCELGNTDSLGFHLSTGFAEANRIICFVKKIENLPS